MEPNFLKTLKHTFLIAFAIPFLLNIFLQPSSKASDRDNSRSLTRSKKDQVIFDRANQKFLNSNFEGAISDYNRVINNIPYDAVTHNNRCYAKYKLNRFNQALEDCNKAISINKNYAEAYDSRGDVYFALGNKDASCIDYKSAIKLNKNSRLAWINSQEGYWCRMKK